MGKRWIVAVAVFACAIVSHATDISLAEAHNEFIDDVLVTTP